MFYNKKKPKRTPVPPAPADEWLLTDEAARRLEIDAVAVRQAVRRGRLVARKIGPTVQVSAASVAEYSRSRDSQPGKKNAKKFR